MGVIESRGMEDPNPIQDANPVPAPNAFINFLVGENKCGTDAKGNPMTPSTFAWFWFLIMILGLSGTFLSLFQKCKDKKNHRGKYAVVGILGVVVAVLNCWIFYQHASKCSAWRGFFITLLISMAYSGISYGVLGDNDCIEN